MRRWWICHIMTSSNGNIFRVTGHLCGEVTGHRWIPRTKASDVELLCFLDLHLNKRLSKQSWGWWFETPSCPLWRHYNEWIYPYYPKSIYWQQGNSKWLWGYGLNRSVTIYNQTRESMDRLNNSCCAPIYLQLVCLPKKIYSAHRV